MSYASDAAEGDYAEALAEDHPDTKVLLAGGPCDGMRVSRPSGRSILVELPWTYMVARYRQSRDRNVFRFREYDEPIARLSPTEEGEPS